MALVTHRAVKFIFYHEEMQKRQKALKEVIYCHNQDNFVDAFSSVRGNHSGGRLGSFYRQTRRHLDLVWALELATTHN